MATKEDKAKLAEGAKAIKKAEAQAKKPEPMVIPASTRDIRDILKDRVTVLDGSIGVKLASDTPIEECLRIMDWATTMSDHVGFMIGDVINFGQSKWGDKYQQAMEQTGRAYKTLADYASVARRIPAAKRRSSLSFSHHREILRLQDETKIEKVLTEVSAQAEKGTAPTQKQLRDKISHLTPRKKKPSKRATSGKGKKKPAKEVKPYEPTDAEQEKMDEAEIALEEASKLVSKLLPVVGRCDNKVKKGFLKAAEAIVTFYNALDKITGY
jgi:hypothetical protein